MCVGVCRRVGCVGGACVCVCVCGWGVYACEGGVGGGGEGKASARVDESDREAGHGTSNAMGACADTSPA